MSVTPKSWLLMLIALAGSSLTGQEKHKASAGAVIFKEKCALCHGADGSGNTPLGKQLHAADLRAANVRRAGDTGVYRVVHDGRANMPPFSDQLTHKEIVQVVKYVRVLAKTPQR